jgi:hypothetical protein
MRSAVGKVEYSSLSNARVVERRSQEKCRFDLGRI